MTQPRKRAAKKKTEAEACAGCSTVAPNPLPDSWMVVVLFAEPGPLSRPVDGQKLFCDRCIANGMAALA